ncbi:MAG: sensor histidine kinase [Xanthobacteraceae bacterium]|nr:sensor histidine kinase [Xanthobacteraceae bacterium]
MKADVDKREALPRHGRRAPAFAALSKLRRSLSYENLSGIVRRIVPSDRTRHVKSSPLRADTEQTLAAPTRPGAWARVVAAMQKWRNFLINESFSSITRRILLLNLAGLVALVSGILYLSEYRAGLIDARIQSLLIQGEIIAGAIASSATVDNYAITINPDRLLELQQGETYSPGEEVLAPLEFPINPERIAPLLRRLVSPTNTRARIYDRDGILILDSRTLYLRGDILRFDLPSPAAEKPGFLTRVWNSLVKRVVRGELPLYKELGPENGKGYPEVGSALYGQNSSVVRANDRGEVIVSVAVPVQRFRAVFGALLLSTQGSEIDAAVEAERFVIVRVFLISASVMALLSFLLAGTIGGPVRRLADAAERVRRRTRSRVEIPDFSSRSDEIGHLSRAIRDMTDALYARIEAIESFAADVAHELKNPLTSLRSAVETLPLVKTEEARNRLLTVIEHDVRRLDRLITDISDASRLDADLQRQEAVPVDLEQLLTALVKIANEVPRGDGVEIGLSFERAPGAPSGFVVPGQDSRLGQVIDNLLENARSFSPPGKTVRITCRRLKGEIEIIVDDDGPGVRPEALGKIFERFYTDRPEHGFGQNSGLGLSISRQIVEGHGGRIWAENRMAPSSRPGGTSRVAGARFIMRLPAA